MALPVYSIFKGKGATVHNIECQTPKKSANQTLSNGIVCKPDKKDTPHYCFSIKSTLEDEQSIEIIINVRTEDKRKKFTRNVYCYFTENFHPQNAENFSLEKLKQLPPGLTILDFDWQSRKKAGIALDYLRSNIFNVNHANELDKLFTELPTTKENEDEEELNDVNEFVHDQVLKAQQSNADIYLFGDAYPHLPKGYEYPNNISNEEERKLRLEFLETRHLGLRGMHGIHMNQGDMMKKKWIENNGVYQDGALLIHYTATNKWSAIFLRFATQCLNTNDVTGQCTK